MKEGESIRQRDKKACNECSPAANPPINQLSGPFPITSLSGAGERDHSENHCTRKGWRYSNDTAPYQLSPGKLDLTAGSALCPRSLFHYPSRKLHIIHIQIRQAYINYKRKVIKAGVKQKSYDNVKILP